MQRRFKGRHVRRSGTKESCEFFFVWYFFVSGVHFSSSISSQVGKEGLVRPIIRQRVSLRRIPESYFTWRRVRRH